jgi:hypothetical protein
VLLLFLLLQLQLLHHDHQEDKRNERINDVVCVRAHVCVCAIVQVVTLSMMVRSPSSTYVICKYKCSSAVAHNFKKQEPTLDIMHSLKFHCDYLTRSLLSLSNHKAWHVLNKDLP